MNAKDVFGDIWITEQGVMLKPKDFSDKHLINTIRYIERNASQIKDVDVMQSTHEDALYLSEISVATYLKDEFPIYPLLKEEARRRGLLNDC
jgi:hypothetical protein